MLPKTDQHAQISSFRIPREKILFGHRLAEVKQVQTSILAHGLLNPVLVVPYRGKLVVMDGKKRLLALRKLRFSGLLPRGLQSIPYRIVGTVESERPAPMSLLSNRESYEQVSRLRRSGMALMEIASNLYITKQCVKDLLNIRRLSTNLRRAFFGGTISLAQARAFVTLPNPDAQDRLLLALGPFASAPDILSAIEAGETVLGLDEDNVIILPSRNNVPATPLAA